MLHLLRAVNCERLVTDVPLAVIPSNFVVGDVRLETFAFDEGNAYCKGSNMHQPPFTCTTRN